MLRFSFFTYNSANFSPSISYFHLTEIILKFNYISRGKARCGGGKVICMFRIENIGHGGRIFLLHSFSQKWRRRWKENVISNFSFILFLRLLCCFDHWYSSKDLHFLWEQLGIMFCIEMYADGDRFGKFFHFISRLPLIHAWVDHVSWNIFV